MMFCLPRSVANPLLTLLLCLLALWPNQPVLAALNVRAAAVKNVLMQEEKTLTQLFGAAAVAQTHTLYAGLQFQPLWQDSLFKNPSQQVITVLENAAADGLNPAHYRLAMLTTAVDAAAQALRTDYSARAVAWKEAVLSAALFKYIADVNDGQTQPDDMYRNRAVREAAADKAARHQDLFLRAISARNMARALRSDKLLRPEYEALAAALGRYRALVEAGGWPALALSQKKLSVGQTDAKRVPLLIKRLEAEGFLPQNTLPTSVYTADIAAAVQQFQARHALNADGVLGPATLRALNITAVEKVEKITLALERWRWLPHTLGDDYIKVNVAGFDLQAYRGGKLALEMPVIVGKRKNQTPMMHTVATDVTFNPYWYMPESILQKKLLPDLRTDPSILARYNYEASFGSYRAAAADMSAVMAHVWQMDGVTPQPEYSASTLRIRQRPGPKNALGRARVGIANNDAIYLHDTPYKRLFARENRALSHGCIRLQNPQGLVDYLLATHADWTRAETAALFNVKNPRQPDVVNLARAVPVYLVYHTAWAKPDGTMYFARDVYGRDAPLLSALNEKVRPAQHLAAR